MDTKFWEVVCDDKENSIGGSGEYCGDNDAQHTTASTYFNKVPWRLVRALRCALRTQARRDWRYRPNPPLGELFSPENFVRHTFGQKLGQRPLRIG
jgi:hypothetical protein